MKRIKLTQDQFAQVDESDYVELVKQNWFAVKTELGDYYATGWTPMVKGKRTSLLMHRVVMRAKKGQLIDHKDGNPLNNQKHNLRFCTASQNGQNQRISKHQSKLSKYKGVTWHRRAKKWQAVIRGKNKQNYYLGSFTKEKDAAKAYDSKASELHGEFARLNFSGIEPEENPRNRIYDTDKEGK